MIASKFSYLLHPIRVKRPQLHGIEILSFDSINLFPCLLCALSHPARNRSPRAAWAYPISIDDPLLPNTTDHHCQRSSSRLVVKEAVDRPAGKSKEAG